MKTVIPKIKMWWHALKSGHRMFVEVKCFQVLGVVIWEKSLYLGCTCGKCYYKHKDSKLP